MNRKRKKIAFELAANLSDYPLRYIVLFGSVARGDDDADSDLDLFLVFDTEDKPSGILLKEISGVVDDIVEKHDVAIDIVCANKNYDGLDPYFIQQVFSEGTLLYARSPKVELNEMPVRAFTFITYTLKGISSANQKKLKAQLYGNKPRKTASGERMGDFSQGLLRQLGGTKLGSNVLMLPTQNLGPVKKLLEEYEVPYSEIDTWLFV